MLRFIYGGRNLFYEICVKIYLWGEVDLWDLNWNFRIDKYFFLIFIFHF